MPDLILVSATHKHAHTHTLPRLSISTMFVYFHYEFVQSPLCLLILFFKIRGEIIDDRVMYLSSVLHCIFILSGQRIEVGVAKTWVALGLSWVLVCLGLLVQVFDRTWA